MNHPVINTSRLIIRPFLISDAEQLFHLNASEQVMKYLPKDEVYDREEQAKQFLKAYLDKSVGTDFVRQVVLRRSDGCWLGWCGLARQENGEVDLGFRFHERAWGKGYATESGLAWLKYGFRERGLDEIIARAAKGNIGSQRALEKLGLRREAEKDHTQAGFRWLRYKLNRDMFLEEK